MVADSTGGVSPPMKPIDTTKFVQALDALPVQFSKTSYIEASKRLLKTVFFVVVTIHGLSIAPTWLLPVCWALAASGFTFLFEIGHDCSKNAFFPSKVLNYVIGTLTLLPHLQSYDFWQRKHAVRGSSATSKMAAAKKKDDDAEFDLDFGDDSDDEGESSTHAKSGKGKKKGNQSKKQGKKSSKGSSSSSSSSSSKRPTHVKSWGSTCWGLSSMCQGFGLSQLLVLAVAVGIVPYAVYNLGFWVVSKYWLIPFLAFNFWMGEYVKQGYNMHVDISKVVSLPKGVRFDFGLRSYLDMNMKIPSYYLADAMSAVKLTWSRLEIDGSDGYVDGPLALHDNISVSSFRRGFRQLGMFESGLSLVLRLACLVWVWVAFDSGIWTLPSSNDVISLVKELPETELAIPTVASVRAALTSAPDYMYPLAGLTIVISFIVAVRYASRACDVYLVNFVTFTPKRDDLSVPTQRFKAIQREFPFSEDSLSFMDRLIERTGLGESTCFPPGTLTSPPDLSMDMARAEAEMVMYGCLEQLFATTGLKPSDIDIFIVNCSLFNPTPSLTSMCVNKFKMREDVQSYNLSGMGCSAGVIAIHLAKDLLRVHKNSNAVVISTENITQNWYRGNEKGMLISNTLFRVGGAAVLLSNKPSDRLRSKYKLLHSIRTHRGADDESYRSVFQEQDGCGNTGVRLSKGLMKVAGEALKRNITTLGPLVLPFSEQFKYFWVNMLQRKILKRKIPPFVPDFHKGIDHFCIHAGGRAVIEAIEENLKLTPQDVAASKAVLKRYGNTSSSSIWYEMAFHEKEGAVHRGHKVWQIAFGSGFKCNSAVWEAL